MHRYNIKPKFQLGASRHDTTRHDMHFRTGKSRDMLCRSCLAAGRHAWQYTHDTFCVSCRVV